MGPPPMRPSSGFPNCAMLLSFGLAVVFGVESNAPIMVSTVQFYAKRKKNAAFPTKETELFVRLSWRLFRTATFLALARG